MTERWTDKKTGYTGGVPDSTNDLSFKRSLKEDLGDLFITKMSQAETDGSEVIVKGHGKYQKVIYNQQKEDSIVSPNIGSLVVWSITSGIITVQLWDITKIKASLLKTKTVTISTNDNVISCGWDNNQNCLFLICATLLSDNLSFSVYALYLLNSVKKVVVFTTTNNENNIAGVAASVHYSPNGKYSISILYNSHVVGDSSYRDIMVYNTNDNNQITLQRVYVGTSYCFLDWTDLTQTTPPTLLKDKPRIWVVGVNIETMGSGQYLVYRNKVGVTAIIPLSSASSVLYLSAKINDIFLCVGNNAGVIAAKSCDVNNPAIQTVLATGDDCWKYAFCAYIENSDVIFSGYNNNVYSNNFNELLYSIPSMSSLNGISYVVRK